MEIMENAKHAKMRSPDGMAERRAAWCKTGIIALRDLQLTAVDPGWLEGELIAVHCMSGLMKASMLMQSCYNRHGKRCAAAQSACLQAAFLLVVS